MEETKKCPKCGKEMEEGYILNPTHYGYANRYWVKELVQRKVFGMKWSGLKYEDGNPVKTMKCVNCGYLENYAK